jgi:hypothetical protein
VPVGGTSGQVLTKNSATDYDTRWATPSAGGGGGDGYQPGSADRPPTTPNAKDDEFDGTSSVTWTTTPTAPATMNANTTRESHLYLKAAGTAATFVGKYQPVPAFPFTVTIKNAGSTGRANYHKNGGLLLLPSGAISSTSSAAYIGPGYNAQDGSGHCVFRWTGTVAGSFSAQSTPLRPLRLGGVYVRATFTSATSVTWSYSADGFAWLPGETYTVPFSVGNIGVAANEEAALGGVEAYFDFFRVT